MSLARTFTERLDELLEERHRLERLQGELVRDHELRLARLAQDRGTNQRRIDTILGERARHLLTDEATP